jgi:hypothetical protein
MVDFQKDATDFEKKLRDRYDAMKSGADESPWKGIPLSLSEFIAHEEHMNFPQITAKQMATLRQLLGDDPTKTFTDRIYETGVFAAGKGSGKDLISCIALCYVVYVLLHLKNPQLYLFKADIPGESIDLINVAPSAELATYVFFEKLKQRVRHWKWLKRNYKIRVSGKELEAKDKELTQDTVIVHPRDIVFPHNIRCFSRHSDVDLSEGFNIIFGVMDEASAFPDAYKVYSMLKSSAKSRFPSAFRVLILSWPRNPEDEDFTLQMVEQAKTDPSICVLQGATWEILPSWKFKGPTFDFHYEGQILKIPIEYEKEFLEEPEDSLMKYAAIAPKTSGGSFYTFPEKVPGSVNKDRLPIAEYREEIIKAPTGDERIGKVLVKYNIPRQPDAYSYYGHIDLGEYRDSAAVAIGHKTPDGVAVIDLVLEWIPDYRNRRPVDFNNVTDILIDLKTRLVNLVYVSADQFQSVQMIQTLQNNGVNAERKAVNKVVMENARAAFYSGRVDMLNDQRTIDQLTLLKDYGNKVAAPDKGKYSKDEGVAGRLKNRDDRAIAVSGLIDTLVGPKKAGDTLRSGEYDSTQSTEGDGAFAGFGALANLR